MAEAKWIGPAVERMREKGTIGSLTRAAKNAGMKPMAFARKMKASPNASPAMKKKSNFAININK